ncbi:MAG: hypothetical protein K9M07_06380 [Simkaniaceae bacterium]|nr:hypothetical protein [Simkaniaceae bacterium]
MAAVARRVVGGIGVIVASGLAGTALWMQRISPHLEDERKGSLLERCRETGLAVINREMIKDRDVRERHVDLVARMSSRSYAESVGSELLTAEQVSQLEISYFAGYLFEAVERDAQRDGIPVFRYTEDLPVYLPQIDGKPYTGFVFSGETTRLFDSEARRSILGGNYVRCSASIPQKIDEGRFGEVILSGTTDCRKCREFGLAFLSDVAYTAAQRGRLSPKYPLSDTPVVEFNGTSLKFGGDLAKLSDSGREQIRGLNFTVCSPYALKTRLSRGSYKEVGVIVTGTESHELCEVLYSKFMGELIASTKRA